MDFYGEVIFNDFMMFFENIYDWKIGVSDVIFMDVLKFGVFEGKLEMFCIDMSSFDNMYWF